MAIYTFENKKYVVEDVVVDLLDQVIVMGQLLGYTVYSGTERGLSIAFRNDKRSAQLSVTKWAAKVYFYNHFYKIGESTGGTRHPWEKPFKELVEWF